jgi:predicted O-methyltransferase YrrM
MAANFEFTYDWVSRAIPDWQRELAPMAGAAGLRFAEVGVYEGRATVWFLRNVLTHPSARIDCIDSFVWDGKPADTDMQIVKRRFLSNIKLTGAAEKVRLIETRSDDGLCGLAPSSYDCIYIDGSHRAPDVLSDAILSFRLLKPAGLLIFDDYHIARIRKKEPSLDDPKVAIDAFLAIYAGRLEIVWAGYQVVVRRREQH